MILSYINVNVEITSDNKWLDGQNNRFQVFREFS